MLSLNYLEQNYGLHIDDFTNIVANNILIRRYYKDYIDPDSITFINHHLAHALSAYYPSGFDESAVLVMDGAGDFISDSHAETTSFWCGDGTDIYKITTHYGECISREVYYDITIPLQNSIGGFYRVITNLLEFGLFGEGKVMGLASYGNERMYKILRKLVDYGIDGEFYCSNDSYKKIIEISSSLKTFKERANLAYALQTITEEAVINAATALKRMTKSKNLCLAGGLMLNSVANYKLYKRGLFDNIFIQPAAGDNGTSIGAAYYGYYHGKINNYFNDISSIK